MHYFTSLGYFRLGVFDEIQEGVMGRLPLLVENINVLCLFRLAHVHPAGCGGVALDGHLVPRHKLAKQFQPLQLGRLKNWVMLTFTVT
jgi:hypothetical protein